MRNRYMIIHNLPPDLWADITDDPATSDTPYDILLLFWYKKNGGIYLLYQVAARTGRDWISAIPERIYAKRNLSPLAVLISQTWDHQNITLLDLRLTSCAWERGLASTLDNSFLPLCDL